MSAADRPQPALRLGATDGAGMPLDDLYCAHVQRPWDEVILRLLTGLFQEGFSLWPDVDAADAQPASPREFRSRSLLLLLSHPQAARYAHTESSGVLLRMPIQIALRQQDADRVRIDFADPRQSLLLSHEPGAQAVAHDLLARLHRVMVALGDER